MNSDAPAPSYADKIRKHLLSICDLAALDDDERYDRMEEWQKQALETWRSVHEKYDSETAVNLVIQSLGDSREVARWLRDPWLYRLVVQYRLQSLRLLLLSIAGLLISYIETIVSLTIRYGIEGPVFSVLLYCGHSFFGAICALLIYWRRNVVGQRYQIFRSILLPVIAIGIVLKMTVTYFEVAVSELTEGHWWWFRLLVEGVLLLLAGIGLFLAWLSLIAEVCDLPDQKPGRKATSELPALSRIVGKRLMKAIQAMHSFVRDVRYEMAILEAEAVATRDSQNAKL